MLFLILHSLLDKTFYLLDNYNMKFVLQWYKAAYRQHNLRLKLSRGEYQMEFRKYRFRLILMIIILTSFLVLSSCVSTGVTPKAQSHSTKVNVFSQGKERYESGDYESALKFFLKATKSGPTNWLPYNWLGSTYFKLKKYDDAIIHFKIANNLKEVSGNYQGLGKAYFELVSCQLSIVG